METHGARQEGHVAVLLQQSIEGLNLSPDATYVDATVGNAGHALEVFRRFGRNVRIIALDADPSRTLYAREVLTKAGARAQVFNENFRNLDRVLKEAGVSTVNALLFDLGLNSEQLESSGRGFSFKRDEPLLMTFGDPVNGTLTAKQILERYDEASLAHLLHELGEEREANHIARAIVEARRKYPIRTTFELVEVIAKGYRGKYPRSIHFATRTFQALRMEVNDELGALTEGLSKGFAALAPHGRMGVISFHSLEDRMVKNFMRDRAKAQEAALLTRKPIVPSDAEMHQNPRSRSAKLRILEKR